MHYLLYLYVIFKLVLYMFNVYLIDCHIVFYMYIL